MSRSINRNLRDQSVGERIWLRRRCWGRNQTDEAARLGTNKSYLVEVERDRRDPSPEMKTSLPREIRGFFELCLLARRRSGLGLAEIARQNGVSVVTLVKWERGRGSRLREYWERHGYRGFTG